MSNLTEVQTDVKVSILVAARNEESNIINCLNSLHQQIFPKGNLEVLIGDDGSTDATASLVKSFITDKPEFQYFYIESPIANLKGKANVLAQLANNARGTILLFCDADIVTQNHWCASMVDAFKGQIGIVTGVTRMKKGGGLRNFLSLEWIFALFMIRIASYFNIPITAMGNNMGVSKNAYLEVGGYEKIRFSVVEDFALFMAVIQKGFGFTCLFQPSILSFTEPLMTFASWKAQRIRWIQGVRESDLKTRFLIFVLVCQFPGILWLSILLGGSWFYLLGFHYLLISGITLVAIVLLRQFDLIKAVLFFWLYLLIGSIYMLWFYFFSKQVEWKGRKY